MAFLFNQRGSQVLGIHCSLGCVARSFLESHRRAYALGSRRRRGPLLNFPGRCTASLCPSTCTGLLCVRPRRESVTKSLNMMKKVTFFSFLLLFLRLFFSYFFVFYFFQHCSRYRRNFFLVRGQCIRVLYQSFTFQFKVTSLTFDIFNNCFFFII